MRQVIWLYAERMDHAGFSFSLFGNCMIVPKIYIIIIIIKLDKKTSFNFAFKISVFHHPCLYSLNFRVKYLKQ